MFFQTHWLIGETVARIAYNDEPGSINPRAFSWGCVLPDIANPYNQIPHTVKDSYWLFSTLLAQAQAPTFNSGWDFSVHIGMLSHFISDYFCRAHNDPELIEFVPHAIYETKMLGKANGKKIQKLAASYLQNERDEISDVHQYLEYKHSCYLNSPPGPDTDIAYAVEMVLNVALTLLKPKPQNLLRVA
jgi:hypothetical protein